MKAREFILGFFSGYTQMTGLAGPNLDNYLDYCEKHMFKEVHVYEKDPEVLRYQVLNSQKQPTSHKLGDINKALIKEDMLYDLDYCCTVSSVKDSIKRWKKGFIMTFSRRRLGNKSIDIFFELREETVNFVREFTSPIKHSLYMTDKGQYIYTPYFDTSAMFTVAKIK